MGMPSISVEIIAKVAHSANVEYCKCLGDYIPPIWEDLDEYRRQGIIQGAMQIIEQPTISPESIHRSWCDYHFAHGWRFGTRNETDKTHPCLLPWKELPVFERIKDVIFVNIVKSFIEGVKQ